MDGKGRVAIITGVGQGIGKGMVAHFLRSGMKMAIAEMDTEAGRETEAEYRGIDVLINNAGIANIEVSGWKKRSKAHKAELTREDNEQQPVGRVGSPEDVAALALFLSSPEASYITRANYVVDGGMTRKMIYV
jgi:NAD(P)-dependent dehydrogenase (short-subunit alcohol dehydrogenase family)